MSVSRPIAVVAMLLLPVAAGCGDAAAPPTGAPADPAAEYIAVRRAWAPGERDTTIARAKRNHELLFPFVGDLSEYADSIYRDLDSVTVIVPNPLFAGSPTPAPGLLMAPRFAGSWNITGIDVLVINRDITPADTLHYIGAFWSNPAESNWKGFALGAAASAAATALPQTQVNTTTFTAANNRIGVGAGEMRASTGTYWEANGPGISPSNTLQVSSATYGGATSVTTGPFLGGTQASGQMFGRMRTIAMTRVSGPSSPLSFSVDFDFSVTRINAIRYVCYFRTPCSTNVPAVAASIRAARR